MKNKSCTACKNSTTGGDESVSKSIEYPIPSCPVNPQRNGVHLWEIDTSCSGFSYECKLCGFKI